MSGRKLIDFGDFTLAEYGDGPDAETVLLVASKRDYAMGFASDRVASYLTMPQSHKMFMPRFVWNALCEIGAVGDQANRVLFEHAWKIGDPRPEESSRAVSEIVTFLRGLVRMARLRGV